MSSILPIIMSLSDLVRFVAGAGVVSFGTAFTAFSAHDLAAKISATPYIGWVGQGALEYAIPAAIGLCGLYLGMRAGTSNEYFNHRLEGDHWKKGDLNVNAGTFSIGALSAVGSYYIIENFVNVGRKMGEILSGPLGPIGASIAEYGIPGIIGACVVASALKTVRNDMRFVAFDKYISGS